MVFGRGYVAPPGAFRGEKRVAPNHFLTPPKFGKGIKGNLLFILLFFRTLDRLKLGAATLIQLQLNSTPIARHFRSFPGIFHHNHGSYHNRGNREETSGKEQN
jgi:hypothetical protein